MNPFGNTCCTKRRRNSTPDSVITFDTKDGFPRGIELKSTPPGFKQACNSGSTRGNSWLGT